MGKSKVDPSRKVALVVNKQSGEFPIYEDDYNKWSPVIKTLSEKYGVPEDLIHSVLAQESEYGNMSKAGNNIMQVTPIAVKEMNKPYFINKYGYAPISANFKTKEEGLEAGVRYLAWIRDHGAKGGKAIDVNDTFAIGKKYNGGDSYGRNMETMVKQFGAYRQPKPAPDLTSKLVSIPPTTKPLNVNLMSGNGNPYVRPATLPGLNMPVRQGM